MEIGNNFHGRRKACFIDYSEARTGGSNRARHVGRLLICRIKEANVRSFVKEIYMIVDSFKSAASHKWKIAGGGCNETFNIRICFILTAEWDSGGVACCYDSWSDLVTNPIIPAGWVDFVIVGVL